jgi:hypothetical protein
MSHFGKAIALAMFLAAAAGLPSQAWAKAKAACSKPGQKLTSCDCKGPKFIKSANGKLCVCNVPGGWEAKNGACAKKAAPKKKAPKCKANQELKAGKCVAKKKAPKCKANQELKAGKCVAKKKAPKCKANQELKNGKCVAKKTTKPKKACSKPGAALSSCDCKGPKMMVSPNGKLCVCNVPEGWKASGGACKKSED